MVVDRYTEALLGGTDARSAEPMPSPIGTLEGEVRYARLLSPTGSEIGALSMTGGAIVEYGVRVGAGVEWFRIHVGCYADGRLAFAAGQPPHPAAEDRSDYCVRLHLPPHLFNEFAYELRAQLEVCRGGEMRIGEPASVLTFSVFNTDPAESAWGDWPWGRPGYICPRLEWRWQVRPPTDLTAS
jgi:hypothetical protein